MAENNNFSNEYSYRQYVRRESGLRYAPIDPELEFYDMIVAGDTKGIEVHVAKSFMDKEGLGVLSENPVQNAKYHLAISAGQIARKCIEAGMDLPTAFGLSDFYISKADVCKSIKDVSDMHRMMCLDYTKRMNMLKKNRISSKPVSLTIDYIYEHLHTRISLKELADNVGLSQSHLSRIFAEETGETITAYINNRKLETAENMLLHSKYTPAQIASILCFCSQSYFTEQFRKKNGVTPKQFLKRG